MSKLTLTSNVYYYFFYLYISAPVFLVCKLLPMDPFILRSLQLWRKVMAAFRLNFFKHKPGVCVAMQSRFVHQCCVNGVKCNSVQILQTTTPTDFNTFYCCFFVPM